MTLAIIPARAGSKSIQNKNVRPLAGRSPMNRAMDIGNWLVSNGVIQQYYVSSDIDWGGCERIMPGCDDPAQYRSGEWIVRPSALAQDDTPMIAVVQHVLEQIPGPPDQRIVLLQPTAVLREPKHIHQALALLTPEVDSVVSVVELPKTHHADVQMIVSEAGYLAAAWTDDYGRGVQDFVGRRQELEPTYIRDGTVYVFWRRTVEHHGNIYGHCPKALIIPPEETCALDTMADWAEAERRLKERA